MYLKKGYLLIGLGVILLLFCIRNILIMPHVFTDGLTQLEYEVLSNIDNETLKIELSKNIGQDLSKISVKQEDKRLIIELDQLKPEKLKFIKEYMDQKYVNQMQMIRANTIETGSPNSTFYFIITILSILLLIGVALIVKGVLLLRTENKAGNPEYIQ